MRRSAQLRGVATALAVAALVACSGGDHEAGRVLTGTFTVTVRSGTGDPCGAMPAHPDLVDGAPVVVRDRDGRELTTGKVGAGTAKGRACVRPVQLGSVARLDLYRIWIGTFGPIDVTAESLDAAGSTMDLRVGV